MLLLLLLAVNMRFNKVQGRCGSEAHVSRFKWTHYLHLKAFIIPSSNIIIISMKFSQVINIFQDCWVENNYFRFNSTIFNLWSWGFGTNIYDCIVKWVVSLVENLQSHFCVWFAIQTLDGKGPDFDLIFFVHFSCKL